MRLLFIILLSCYGLILNAQEADIAPLEAELEMATEDSSRVRILCQLCRASRRFDTERAMDYAKRAFDIALGINDNVAVAQAVSSYAAVQNYLGNYNKTISISRKALDLLQGDTIRFSQNSYRVNMQYGGAFTSLGMAYDYKSDQPNAIRYHLMSRDAYLSAGYEPGVAVSHNNMGISYLYMDDLEKSEEHFQEAIKIYLSRGDSILAYQARMNLGIIDYFNGKIEEAIITFKECALVMQLTGNLRSLSNCYGNIGECYLELSEFDSSKKYLGLTIEKDIELNDPEAKSNSYRMMGKFYEFQEDYNNARIFYQKALQESESINQLSGISQAYMKLGRIEEKDGNFKKALEYYRIHLTYHDSLIQDNNSRLMGKIEAQHEYNKKIELEKADNEKKVQLESENRKKQSIIIYFSIGLIVVILFFVYMVIKSLRLAKRQKVLADQAKEEIEEKNTELLDSIRYAKRIQLALLKEDDEDLRSLPGHFILFEPKDIVSGDFYWTWRKDDYWYVAVGDCTGHGVPGALLTMLGTAYLNEICAIDKVLSPAEILDQLKAKVTLELGQTGLKGSSKDGMDMSLIRMNLVTKEVIWAGANNPVYYIANDQLNEIKADKQPIGYSDQIKSFTDHQLQITPGDSIYLFSDGFADQFGGPNGKKYKYSRLKELLFNSDRDEPTKQKSKLLAEFDAWKGDYEQLDDVCIIGVRI